MIMRFKNLTATPHLSGNRIDLKWINPVPDQYPYVRVMRREQTHPNALKEGVLLTAPDDGILVIEKKALLFEINSGADQSLENNLNNEELSPAWRQKFFTNGVSLSYKAAVSCEASGSKWRITDEEKKYLIKKDNPMLRVYLQGPAFVSDENLKGETVYYYTLFPFKGDPPEYYFDPQNRVSAMSCSSFNMAGQMYDLLPSIYHRYDTKLPLEKFRDQMSEEDCQKGQLHRFLDIAGCLLDQLYSSARAMLDLHDLNKVEGTLLPLLAQWIGWETDYRLEIEDQRKEIRNAPSIYRTIGIIPTVEATVKRIIGWENRTKEFVHNIFLTNSPERLNIWALRRSDAGQWLELGEPPKPLSLDFAYEGRPAAARQGDGTLWLFYHTLKKHYDLSQKRRKDTWDIWYKTYTVDQGWAPSRPFTNSMAYDRHPTAVVQSLAVGEALWVFWDTYDEAEGLWRINYRKKIGEQWSAIKDFGILEAVPDWIIFHSWSMEYPDHRTVDFTKTPIDIRFRTWHIETQRRMAWATVDHNGGLWLFWCEKIKGEVGWQLKYNRNNGARWELEPAGTFPLDEGEDPGVESDLFVLYHPDQRIWVFWARKGTPGGPREIAYRIKQDLDPKTSNWSEIYILPKPEPDDNGRVPDDCEPSALVKENGEIELFWSTNQNGSWSVWRIDITNTIVRESAEQVTDNPYSQRNPLLISKSNVEDALLIFRSNESLHYTSEDYKATKTIDSRYAGCTAVDTGNIAKNNFRGKLEDFQTYTYDAGKDGKRSNENWYCRDTIGVYLTPETEERKKINLSQYLIEDILRRFMPIQLRAVFIINPPVYKELVYNHGHPEEDIREKFFDSLEVPASEADDYTGLSDWYRDEAPDWVWLRSWSEEYTDHQTVDFTASPIVTRFRTRHIALNAGGG